MRKNNRGFTVVELIVSIALLAVILVPVAGFFMNSFKLQSKTSMKTSITRVGQYIMENFKNKNYLADSPNNEENLRNSTGTFKEFVEGIRVSRFSKDDPYEFDNTNGNVEDERSWKLTYKEVDYNINISIPGFTVSDMSEFNIPTTFDGAVEISESGNFVNSTSNIITYEIGESFTDPINGKNYTANHPTIILPEIYTTNTSANLLITNNYGELNAWEKIRIIKPFTEELQVYIEGDNISILKGQEGDGASAAQTRIISSYVGNEIETNKKSSSELLLDAKMTISNANDDSIRDTFEFSFPVNYDYSEEGE